MTKLGATVVVAGDAADHVRASDSSLLTPINRVRAPREFYTLVRDALTPGATILVTQSSVGESAGRRLTIPDAVKPKP